MSAFNNSLGSALRDQPMDKADSPLGRGDGQSGEGSLAGEERASGHCSARKAGVVIRATVEHMGLVGDTELTVNVKWPASTFCVQPGGKQATSPSRALEEQQVPGNGPQAANFDTLYGESTDPKPAITLSEQKTE